jgi:hypothetical protein
MLLLAVTALLMVALAMPAFAAPSPTANCIGQIAVGFGGQVVSNDAQAGNTSENATFCACGHSKSLY